MDAKTESHAAAGPGGNALAELSERLTPDEVLNIEGRLVARGVDFDALVRAQRIVAELARVNMLEGRGDTYKAFDCLGAVKTCRVIAEEGVEDGSRQ